MSQRIRPVSVRIQRVEERLVLGSEYVVLSTLRKLRLTRREFSLIFIQSWLSYGSQSVRKSSNAMASSDPSDEKLADLHVLSLKYPELLCLQLNVSTSAWRVHTLNSFSPSPIVTRLSSSHSEPLSSREDSEEKEQQMTAEL